ncbi:MAG: glycosyltransferase family 2 protein [Candidatus Schekmanbacteria bacterium]|nr:MAG: glycosyltransferase family 2 protein [Candidatus Schekmanbacteria bacterium]
MFFINKKLAKNHLFKTKQKNRQKIMIWIILPSYNEEEALPILLEKIKETSKGFEDDYKVVVVDDGSSDNTQAILENFKKKIPLEIIRHTKNLGLGKALFNGIKKVVVEASNGDVVITLDADNTHPPTLFKEMITKLREENNQIVIASRYEKGGEEVGLSLFRKILSRSASIIIKAGFDVGNAKDCTCGFRAYDAGILKKGLEIYGDKLIEESSFVCMAELLVKLSHIGAKVSEVPLILRYDLKKGSSKMKYIYTIWRYFNLVIRKNKLLSFPKY